jgi:hypothetical protein
MLGMSGYSQFIRSLRSKKAQLIGHPTSIKLLSGHVLPFNPLDVWVICIKRIDTNQHLL